jgi:hypothetical protein
MTDRWLARQLARHALMGGALGMILALMLLASNCQHLRDMITGSPAPLVQLGVFIGGLSTYLAFGATLTGFLFILQEEDPK